MGGRFPFSVARACAVAFSIIVLTLGYGCYVEYCVVKPTYMGTARVEIAAPIDPDSPNPIRGEIEFMRSPDVLSPIVTDLELDKIWAKRFRSALDALPMQDSLAYLNKLLRLEQVPGTNIVTVSVYSDVPRECSGIANAVAERYETERERSVDQLFTEKEHIMDGQIAQQAKVVAQKSDALGQVRLQLHSEGISVAPGAAGVITTDLAVQKSGSPAQVDALAPLRSAQAQLDAQQSALDDLQLRLRQLKNENQLTETPVKIISLASPPEYPCAPNHSLDLMVYLIAGVVLGITAGVPLELVLWYFARISPPPVPRPAIPVSATPASAQY